MSTRIIVAGTDTDIGKTVFAAALTRALGGAYWKPVQAGLSGETDREVVQCLGALSDADVLPEIYRLSMPASPHSAAAHDDITIDPARLTPAASAKPLVIELAGGLAVPLTPSLLQIDLLSTWAAPVVLCAATRLGTINHTLLSIEALKRRAIPILGVAFIGDAAPEAEHAIGSFGRVRRLGRLPHLAPLTAETLHAAFAANFRVADILGLGEGGP